MKKKKSTIDLVKETPEERKKRINETGNRYITRVVKSKKVYNRKKQNKFDE